MYTSGFSHLVSHFLASDNDHSLMGVGGPAPTTCLLFLEADLCVQQKKKQKNVSEEISTYGITRVIWKRKPHRNGTRAMHERAARYKYYNTNHVRVDFRALPLCASNGLQFKVRRPSRRTKRARHTHLPTYTGDPRFSWRTRRARPSNHTKEIVHLRGVTNVRKGLKYGSK